MSIMKFNFLYLFLTKFMLVKKDLIFSKELRLSVDKKGNDMLKYV